MDAVAKGGLWERSLAVLSSMARLRLVPDIFNYNIALEASGDWQQAVGLLGCREGGSPPNGITYSNAMTVLAVHGRWKLALGMARRSLAEQRCAFKSKDIPSQKTRRTVGTMTMRDLR